MGTISGAAGNLMSAPQSSAVIVNSPQAFEQTLQSQENENALPSGHSALMATHQQPSNQLNNQHNHAQQPAVCQHHRAAAQATGCNQQQSVSVWGPGELILFHRQRLTLFAQLNSQIRRQAGPMDTKANQDQKERTNDNNDSSDQQLLNEITHFNYNPLYTGLSQQLHEEFEQQQRDSNQRGANSTLLSNGEQQFRLTANEEGEEDEDDDLMNEIYQFASSSDAHRQHNNHQMAASRHMIPSIRNNGPITISHPQQQQQYGSSLRQQQHQGGTLVQQVFPNQTNLSPMLSVGLIARHPGQTPRGKRNNGQQQQSGHFASQEQQFNSFEAQQLDQMSDDCAALFVEYHNRNPNGDDGNSLEELHSLNVTNCSSETLEEQINLLTGEDCFGSSASSSRFDRHHQQHDSLDTAHQFNGANNNHERQLQQSNNDNLAFISGGLQQQPVQACFGTSGHHESGDPLSPFVDCLAGRLVMEEASAPHEPIQQQRPHQIGHQNSASTNATSTNDQYVATTNGRRKVTKIQCANKGTCNNNRKRPNASKANATSGSKQASVTVTNYAENQAQSKLPASSGQKRLSPGGKSNDSTDKRHANLDNNNNNKQRKSSSEGTNQQSWTTSPIGSSGLTANLSPVSGSKAAGQLADQSAEAPYKQQLDNLRKKLKMDLVGPGQKGAPSFNASKPMSEKQQQQQQQQQKAAPRARPRQVASRTGQAGGLSSNNNLLPSPVLVAGRQVQFERIQPAGASQAGTIFIRTSSGQIVPVTGHQQSFGAYQQATVASSSNTIQVTKQQQQLPFQQQQHNMLWTTSNEQKSLDFGANQGVVLSRNVVGTEAGLLVQHHQPVGHAGDGIMAANQQAGITIPLLITTSSQSADSSLVAPGAGPNQQHLQNGNNNQQQQHHHNHNHHHLNEENNYNGHEQHELIVRPINSI